MGADGHIDIYDLDAIRKELTEKEIDIVVCSVVYKQFIFGRNVLTCYWGDNLYVSWDDYSEMYGYLTKRDNGYVSPEDFKRVVDIIHKHKITSWEVWT